MQITEKIAAAFHATYERLAPTYGYTTSPDSSVAWEDVPAANKDLMIATVAALLQAGVIQPGISPGRRTVYVSIGNSDDKLTQRQWADFVREVSDQVHRLAVEVHGFWLSPPDYAFQNACFCLEIEPARMVMLRRELAHLCRAYRQDSIAWAEVPATEFVRPDRIIYG